MMVLNLSTAAMGLSGIPAAKWASNGAKFAGAGAKTACLVGKAVKAAPYATAVLASGYQAKESFKEGKHLEGTLHIVSAVAFGYRGVHAFKNAKFCFTEGTQIVVGMNYDEHGNFANYDTKNIEDIQVGDLVYSYNTLTGETELTEVTSTFALTSDHINHLTIIDENGDEQVIETTDSHPFWVVTDDPDLERAASEVVDENGAILYHENLEPGSNGFWVEAKDLRVGDVFLGANGELSTLTNIVRVEQEGGIAVFNFTVEGNHNYYIIAKEYEYGQTSVLVHNARICTHTAAQDWINKGVHVTVDNIRGTKQGVELILTAARGGIKISKAFNTTRDEFFNAAKKVLEEGLKSRKIVERILNSARRGEEYVKGVSGTYKGAKEALDRISNCIKELENILTKLK